MTSDERPRRRAVLSSLGGGLAASVAGCTDDVGTGGGDPVYERRAVDVDGEERSESEMATADRLAEQEIHEQVTPLDALVVADHEFSLEDDYRRSTVQGTVENEQDDRIETAEVRVRVYDDEGRQLGPYLDHTVDLDGGSQWSFEVVLLESPDDVAEYGITVLGTPT
ncbi:hypothetical protein CV102_00415 [Natronococcus pandeyae]|uniref:Uncharacterized protein n=1 Tax=Natronococcus pandeyae TaxID=2055836 RepID=A0A8J8Q8Y9_9EURY|nr:FxLYD domain-containing protein [Natronococcus pandeyae]TYL40079.1 hypothetical protein CV102_00415 [Natronococcus pandeyae]